MLVIFFFPMSLIFPSWDCLAPALALKTIGVFSHPPLEALDHFFLLTVRVAPPTDATPLPFFRHTHLTFGTSGRLQEEKLPCLFALNSDFPLHPSVPPNDRFRRWKTFPLSPSIDFLVTCFKPPRGSDSQPRQPVVSLCSNRRFSLRFCYPVCRFSPRSVFRVPSTERVFFFFPLSEGSFQSEQEPPLGGISRPFLIGPEMGLPSPFLVFQFSKRPLPS